jgi:hypothetical protein
MDEYNFKGQHSADAKGVEVTVSVLDPNNNVARLAKLQVT